MGPTLYAICIPFIPSQLQIAPWKPKVKVMGSNTHPYSYRSISHPTPQIQLFQNLTLKMQSQGHSSRSHIGSNILSTHIPLVTCQSTLLLPTYSLATFYFLNLRSRSCLRSKWKVTNDSISFHVNRPSRSRHTASSKSYLENPPFLKYSFFKIWPWKFKVKVICPWCCTTTGKDNSIFLHIVISAAENKASEWDVWT